MVLISGVAPDEGAAHSYFGNYTLDGIIGIRMGMGE